ncbi:MAG: hypothetical protein GY805_31975, partial [Chloroflexi bacterium]|nr:hypothetical protein [Chloroflexota bacterium]
VWNTFFTPLSFFMTALILGCLVVGTVFAVTGSLLNAPVNKDALAMVITGALFVLGCEFALIIGRSAGYRSGSSKGKDTIQKLLASHRNVFYGRLLLGIAGFIGLSVMLLQAHFPPGFCAICFVLVLSAALADRFLFYKARDVSGI